ncbi:MAG: hypothetical protein ACI9BW_002565 [Gammaproteobacteria bacterium]|jgi:hypothetical protein
MNRIWLILVAVAFASPSFADENTYICDATSVLELGESGALEETNYAKALGMHQSHFAVDRKTGEVAGGPFATVDAKDGRVLSSGTDQEALKIVWLTEGPFNHLKYLWVRAYADGAKKPFVGVTGNVVVTGMCE